MTSPFPAHRRAEPKAYYLATIHRAENTDDAGRSQASSPALRIASTAPSSLSIPAPESGSEFGMTPGDDRAIEPVGYLDMLASSARRPVF